MNSFYNSAPVILKAESHDEASARETAIQHLQSEIDFSLTQGSRVAFMLLDIKDFFRINASIGYEAGDELLLNIKSTLSSALKKANHIARIGNNTFCIIIPGIKSPALLELAANKIRQKLAGASDLSNNPLRLSCYIAASASNENTRSAEAMFLETEWSLLNAKREGSQSLALTEKNRGKKTSAIITECLEGAIDNDELFFMFQPKVNLSTMKVDSAEALMRWRSDLSKKISMEEFFSFAERSGLMNKLSDWAIRSVLQEKQIMDQVLTTPISVAINLSTTDLYNDSLTYTINNCLEIWGINPSQLTLEITEGVILQDQQKAFRTLNALRDKGIRISLDDFGTGYSSLAYFKSIPADELKIDKSFVMDICNNDDDAMIIELIVKLAKKFNFKIVAEGVETEEALNKLINMGCDYAQGYYFSAPQYQKDFLTWVNAFNSR